MLDMEEVTKALSSPASGPMESPEGYEESPKGDAGDTGEMQTHSAMMCEVLKNQGRLEAKLDMLIDMQEDDAEEDAAESESEASDGMLALPMGSQSSALTAISYDGFPMP